MNPHRGSDVDPGAGRPGRARGRVRVPSVLRRRPEDREILRLAIPAFFTLVAEPLFLLGDTIVVGRLDAQALASLGIGAAVLAAIVNLCIFLAYGTTGAVARSFGAGDLTRAVRLGVDGMWLGAGIGVALAALSYPAMPVVVSLFGADASVTDPATSWLRVVGLALPPLLLVLAGTGVLRGLQDTRTPLYVAVTASAANLLISWFLVHPGGLGLIGSAWAMVIAQWGAGLAYVAVVARGARRHATGLAPDARGVRSAARAAGPLVVRVAAMRLVLVAAAVVAARLGTVPLAAHQALMAVFGVLMLGLDAVAIAGQAIIGRQLGAGDVRAVRAATTRMLQWGALSGVAFAVGVGLLAPWWTTIFSTDSSVRSAALAAAFVLAVLLVPAGLVFVMDGVLIGAGDLRVLAWQAVLSTLVFVVAITVVIATGGGLVAVWWALVVWMLSRLVMLSLRTRSDAWVRIGIDTPR